MIKQVLKRFTWVVIGVFLLSSAALAAPENRVLGTRQQLSNHLVWLFSRQGELPLVTMELLIKAGTLKDPPGKAGLANLTASLLVNGTKSRSSARIARELDFMGARLSASGGDDFATVSLSVLKKDLGPALNLFRDILLNPTFPVPEMRRKVSQFKAALVSQEDDPGVVASRAFAKHLYGPFPYGHPILGSAQGLSAITRMDLVRFHRQYYRPNNAVLSLVGDLTLKEARRWVAKIFGDWAAAPLPATQLPAIPPLTQRREVVIDKDISQANIVLGNLGITRRNPDFYAFQVMNYILGGGGFASRLMDDIRVNRGLAYSVYSSFSPGLAPGPFAVALETKNPSADQAIRQVVAQLQRIRTQPVTLEELQNAKSYLVGSFPRKMDSMFKRAWLLGYVEVYGLGLDYPWRYPELIQHLQPADIQQVAQKYIHPEKYLLVIVGKKSAMTSPGAVPRQKKEEKKDEKT
ncbi:MAG: pitrilysin family protein [Deltaproteobacteria bacterium]|jgi:zinc protease